VKHTALVGIEPTAFRS